MPLGTSLGSLGASMPGPLVGVLLLVGGPLSLGFPLRMPLALHLHLMGGWQGRQLMRFTGTGVAPHPGLVLCRESKIKINSGLPLAYDTLLREHVDDCLGAAEDIGPACLMLLMHAILLRVLWQS